MSKITTEMWEKAIHHLHTVLEKEKRSLYRSPSRLTACSYISVLQDRYDEGERSIELYNAIMELC